MSKTTESNRDTRHAALPPQAQAALADLCLNLLPIWSRQLVTSRQQSELAVGQILSAFNAINPVLQQLIPEGGTTAQSLEPHIEQLYVGLQFQDRISQMLALLQEDITRLHGLLEQAAPDVAELAVPHWLARLESLYAMAEQRRDHDQSAQGGQPGTDNEVSFF